MKQITFETERLLLRPLITADLKFHHEYSSDWETVKYMYALSFPKGSVVPEEKTFAYLNTCELEWKKDAPEFYEFAVVEKSSAKMIGNICLYPDYPEKAECEIGWMFNRAYQRKGYCTEAALRLKTFAVESLGIKKLIAHCDERNLASSKVMEKLGMKKVWGNGVRVYPNTGEEATEAMYALDIKDDKNEN